MTAPPANRTIVKKNTSIFDPLLNTENRAKQNAPNKTVMPTSNPENCTSKNLPFVIMMTMPEKPAIKIRNFLIDKVSFKIRLANNTI